MQARLIQRLEPRAAYFDVRAASAQLLKTNVASARAILHRRGQAAIVPFHSLVLLVEVQVLNRLAVEHRFQVRSLERDVVLVPFGRLVHLLKSTLRAVEGGAKPP